MYLLGWFGSQCQTACVHITHIHTQRSTESEREREAKNVGTEQKPKKGFVFSKIENECKRR